MDDSEKRLEGVEDIQNLIAEEEAKLQEQEEEDGGTEQKQEEDVPVVEYTLQPHDSAQQLQCHIRLSQQQLLTSGATCTDHAHSLNQPQLSGCQISSLELSPTSVTQSVLFVPSPNLQGERESPLGNTKCTVVEGAKQNNFSDSRPVSAVKASSVDGYSWRKYGHKQVKSPHGSRSYYKCTNYECYAKKIECSDNLSSVIEVIYRSDHNHDPPKKINGMRGRKFASLAAPVVGSDNTSYPVRTVSSTDPAQSSGEKIQEKHIPEANQQALCGTNEDSQMIVLEEHIIERKPKVSVKKGRTSDPVPISKPSKKPKFVVHAAGDVGISGDGYRWRKYGQKMVKGTPHPRNYYRCTSAGCPVRKHIEMANDSKSALVITYKGMHDHDMPVPKKRHGPPSAPLLAAPAPASINTLEIKKPEAHEKHISATQWSVDKAGELTGEAVDIGGEKTIESAQTLLSIGFEIKPC